MLTPLLGDILAKCLAVEGQVGPCSSLSLPLLLSMLILRSRDPSSTPEQKNLSPCPALGAGGIMNFRIRWTWGHVPGGRGWQEAVFV